MSLELDKFENSNNLRSVVTLQKTILFLICPFGAFLYCLKNIKSKSSFLIFFLFSLLFGWCFTLDLNSEFDGSSYIKKFLEFKSNSDFYYELTQYLQFDSGKKDFYFETISYLVNQITTNYHFLFLVFSFIFSYFLLRSLSFITNNRKYDNGLLSFLLVLLFVSSNSIMNINGMRFWTASWIAVYSFFQIFVNGNKRYFLLLLSTSFFHGSFLLIIVLTFLSFFLKKYDRLWTVLAFFSIPFSYLSFELIEFIYDFLPVFLQKGINPYIDSDYVNFINESGTGFFWVPKISNFTIATFYNIMFFMLLKNRRKVLLNIETRELYRFYLILLTFSQFLMAIPSMGRFYIVSIPLLLFLWFSNFKDTKYEKILYAVPIVFLFKFFWLIFFEYSQITEPFFYFLNFFSLFFEYI